MNVDAPGASAGMGGTVGGTGQNSRMQGVGANAVRAGNLLFWLLTI